MCQHKLLFGFCGLPFALFTIYKLQNTVRKPVCESEEGCSTLFPKLSSVIGLFSGRNVSDSAVRLVHCTNRNTQYCWNFIEFAGEAGGLFDFLNLLLNFSFGLVGQQTTARSWFTILGGVKLGTIATASPDNPVVVPARNPAGNPAGNPVERAGFPFVWRRFVCCGVCSGRQRLPPTDFWCVHIVLFPFCSNNNLTHLDRVRSLRRSLRRP